MPEAGGRAGPDVLRAGKLSLSLIICSTLESGPYTSTGQHRRDGPEGVGVGETTPEDVKVRELALPLVHYCKG